MDSIEGLSDVEDTLRMLSDSVTAFARPNAPRTRAVRDQHQGFDAAVWGEMASLGWLSAVVPEAQAGLGLGLRAGAAIAQRLGYAGHFEPYVAVGVMAVRCLAACAPAAAPHLAAVMAGRQLASLAWQPVGGVIEVDATPVAATPDGQGVRLSGTCRFVAVPQADAFIVAARDPDNLVACWVERDACGVSVERERAVDGTMLGALSLRGVVLSADAVLARGNAAGRALEQAVECGTVITAAELLGVMERALEITIDYLKTREQFGRPIGAFQALQHRAVDMWMQKELARASLQAALKVIDNADADRDARRAAASSAKARASQAALFVCGQAVQLHGAIGFTDEYELGVYVNRGLALAACYGNAAQHRRRYAALAAVTEH